MVFSSIPAYLDPSNWQQQQNHPIIGSSTITTNPLLTQPPSQQQTPPPPPPPHGGSSIRPGSMAERARLANVPMPEQALKCPRCESANTKFCYFNNYSLSQPRHFCKTCRRYWTRGGALRTVPVGGGCRRNKRSKSSKSPASSSMTSSTSNISTSSGSDNINTTSNMLGLTAQIPSLRFMSPLGQLHDGFSTDVGLNYGGLSASALPNPMVGSNEAFHGSGSSLHAHGGHMSSLLSSSGIDPWRLQQYPNFFVSGLDPPSSAQGSLYHQFQGSGDHQIGDFVGGETSSTGGDEMRPKVLFSPSSSVLSQLASVKMEDTIPHELNLSRQLLGGMPTRTEQWNGGNAWSELSSFSSSSTSKASYVVE